MAMSAITATTPIPANTTWTVDPVHSTVGFAVKHMVVSTFRGQFDDYSATLTANEDGTLTLASPVFNGTTWKSPVASSSDSRCGSM